MKYKSEKIITIQFYGDNEPKRTYCTWLNLEAPNSFENMLPDSPAKRFILEILERIDMEKVVMKIDEFDTDSDDLIIRINALDSSWTFKFNTILDGLLLGYNLPPASDVIVTRAIGVYEDGNPECIMVIHNGNTMFDKKVMVIGESQVCLEKNGKLELLNLPLEVTE